MSRLKVIKGGLSEQSNIFKTMEIISCIATDTRLMGVVALKLHWKDGKDDFYQLFHLDFSEYGVDGYQDTKTTDDIQGEWIHMSGGLGGQEINITYSQALGLIKKSLEINRNHRKHHPQELVDFQNFAESLSNDMSSIPHVSEGNYMESTSKRISNSYEAINYFIMRIYDDDTEASMHLSLLSYGEIRDIIFNLGMTGSLIRNRIHETGANTYSCKALILSDSGYFFTEISIALNENKKVTKFRIDQRQRITEIEAAFYTKQTEYITMFRIDSTLEDFHLEDTSLIESPDYKAKDTGFLHVLYNKDNNHVKHRNYFLNEDVYGTYFVTKANQLLLMSHKIVNITRMEEDILNSKLMDHLELVDRYQFENQVLESFMNYFDPNFENFVYDPEA